MRTLLIALLMALPPVLAQRAEAQAADSIKIADPAFIALSVDDLDREIAWFERLFGTTTDRLVEIPGDRGRIALLSSGPLLVELIALNSASAPFSEGDSGPRALVLGPVKAGIFVLDAAAARRALEAKGAALHGDLFEDPTFKKLSFQIKDPEGNVIQFFETGE